MNIPQELRKLAQEATEDSTRGNVKISSVSTIVQEIPTEPSTAKEREDVNYVPRAHKDKQTLSLTNRDGGDQSASKSRKGKNEVHAHYSLPTTEFRMDLAGVKPNELAATIVHESLVHLLDGYSTAILGWGQGGVYKSGLLNSYTTGGPVSLLQLYIQTLLRYGKDNPSIRVYFSCLQTQKKEVTDLLYPRVGDEKRGTYRTLEDAFSQCWNLRMTSMQDFGSAMEALVKNYGRFFRETQGRSYIMMPPRNETGLVGRIIVENKSNGTCPSLFLVDTPPLDQFSQKESSSSATSANIFRAVLSQNKQSEMSNAVAQPLPVLHSTMLARLIHMVCRSSMRLYSLLFLTGSKTRGTIYNLLRIQQSLRSLETLAAKCFGEFHLPLADIGDFSPHEESDTDYTGGEEGGTAASIQQHREANNKENRASARYSEAHGIPEEDSLAGETNSQSDEEDDSYNGGGRLGLTTATNDDEELLAKSSQLLGEIPNTSSSANLYEYDENLNELSDRISHLLDNGE
eukprot:gb/GECG01002130.1/.p1 GENE.gb/GECG01002130.1/~~gb/GECG01002130.1/.p1  ORF type:complete len:515 (+),score=66.15 gb/GECG01002130.1/:1-1545(+)